MSQGPVWAVLVEIVLVFGQDRCRVVLVDDEGPVEEFAADAADEPFGDRVRARRSNRGCDHLDVGAGEDGVERGGELGVTIADQEPEALPMSSRSMVRLRASWVRHALVGWAATPRM